MPEHDVRLSARSGVRTWMDKRRFGRDSKGNRGVRVGTAPIGLLREVVSELTPHVAVVKNPDIWGSIARSGDWDLIADDTRSVYRTLTRLLGDPVWVNHRSYVININWDWGHIDLLPDIRWRGIQLVSAEAVLRDCIITCDLPVARVAHQALSACIFSVLAYGDINQRYDEVWAAARREDSAAFKAIVDNIFGDNSGVDLMLMKELTPAARRLRRAAVRCALRSDLGSTLARTAEFAVREGWVRLKSVSH